MSRMLCLFKSSRRIEYTQENLRILSGAVGSEVAVAYKERWLAESVRSEVPEVGDAAVVSLADPPYKRSYPVRMTEVVEATFEGGTLRLRLRVGARVNADQNRWKPLVAEGDNPKAGQFALHLDVDDGVLEEVSDPEREVKVWKKQIDAVSHAEGYARVAFLRVGAVTEVGGDPVVSPYRLTTMRTYQVDVIGHNPHLERETLDALRLVAFPDPAVVDVALDTQPIPAEGTIELMLVPQDIGEAELEFSCSRGSDFWFGLALGWQTIAAPAETIEEAPRFDEPPPTPVLEAPARSLAAEAPAAMAGDIGRHLVRGYMLLRGHSDVPAAVRLRLLDEMLEAAPGHPRLLEQRGIAFHELRRWADAVETLEPLETLSAEGRTMLVWGWFMQGRVPEPIERVTIADLSRDDWFEGVLEASTRLTTEEQVRVARLLANSVLAEDRASRWIEPLAMSEDLPRRDRLDLFEIWQYADPSAAAAGVDHLAADADIDLAEPDLAQIALDLGIEAQRTSLARRAAWALMTNLADLGNVPALESLLDTVMNQFTRDARREVGEEIVLTIADVAGEDDEIDRALEAAAVLIEDQRQRGDLEAAARLAVFAHANDHRASGPVRQRLKGVLDQLQKALDRSSAVMRYQDARRREMNLDIKDFVGGKRLLVLGANEQKWWPDVRQEFGFSADSEWLSTERNKALPVDRIIKKLDGFDMLVVQTGRIGHKTSEPVMKAAKARGMRTFAVPRPTRDALTIVLRVGLGDQGGPSGTPSGSILDVLT